MSARLVPVRGGNLVYLDKAIIVIGRNPDCDVVLAESRKISRLHCCIAQVDDKFVVRDLGSTNGVSLNGKRIREARLRHGDELVIGDVTFQVQVVAESPEPRAGSPSKRVAPTSAGAERPAAKAGQPPKPQELSLEFPVPISEAVDDILKDWTPGDDARESRGSEDSDLRLGGSHFELRNLEDSGVV